MQTIRQREVKNLVEIDKTKEYLKAIDNYDKALQVLAKKYDLKIHHDSSNSTIHFCKKMLGIFSGKTVLFWYPYRKDKPHVYIDDEQYRELAEQVEKTVNQKRQIEKEYLKSR